jgi:hypothetical protein
LARIAWKEDGRSHDHVVDAGLLEDPQILLGTELAAIGRVHRRGHALLGLGPETGVREWQLSLALSRAMYIF